MRTRYVAGFMFAEYESARGELVAVIKKNRPTWQAGRYNGIGGHIEAGELPRDAMAREFAEETGFSTRPDDWTPYVTLHGPIFAVEFFFCWGPVYELKSVTDEEIVLVPPSRLSVENAIPNLTWLVPMALSIAHDSADSMIVEERHCPLDVLCAPSVYLSGGIAGLGAEECSGWRRDAARMLDHRLRPLDPLRWDTSNSPVGEIVERDLRDIDRCEAVLVKVDRPSWGTAMEVRYAYQLGRPIIAFGTPNVSSAWLEHHCDALHPTLESACEDLNRRLCPALAG